MAIPEATRAKAIAQLTAILSELREFEPTAAAAYAESVVSAMAAAFTDKEDFRDQLMSLLANMRSLDGELTQVGPAVLATMKPQEMLSRKQRQERNRFLRKRTREQIVYDATSMLCTTCKLVRPDRLNLNQLALDSEENGTQFDYNFDNLCQCTHDSDEDTSSTSSSSDTDKDEVSTNKDDSTHS
ncbi:uncharacterized protein TM35_000025170 [Trypanosoma theileri]|uniref:TFIIS central domain-containing protein n=1 Tax=Trypanosoma theileri TaxID=67003 RepID=A0A1X0P8N4_9TRYP|nr:uncharacterized protein TM35_000025170 [Trypanosoma theileri]ORC93191.1 hypothetical protein TM35_000025170 [Trypanosoma theileri]